MATVAVIIVNYNAGNWLEKCLFALKQQSYSDFLTIVVDNNSTDGSVDNLEELFPGVCVLRQKENLGFAAGNNVGVRAAGDIEWIACLNPDAFPAVDWLEQLIKYANQNRDFAVFGSCMELADRPGFLDGTGDVYHASGLAWRRHHMAALTDTKNAEHEIFAPCAAAALYRRDAFVEAGGFDERYFCYFEDVDLAFRLRLLGYRCAYVQSANVRHVGSGITGYRSNFSVYHGHRNLIWTYVKNMPGFLFWSFLPLHLFMNISVIFVFFLRGQGRIILKAKLDAIVGLPYAIRQRRVIQASRKVRPFAILSNMSRSLFAPFKAR